MALAATTIWEVETTGSDTLNGGAFDPGQTAGMFTDGAATVATSAAPVFTSASYNFVAGDVGAWIYIASGVNWTAGWYKITSVAANAATLNATIGQGVLNTKQTPTTVVGCASVASPTSATWSIDYSQQAAAQFAYTDLASVGAGLLVASVAFPFAKQQVGNCLVITGGTNFTTGRYVIASVAAGVATVVGAANITTGAGANGTGGQGGALVSPGQVGVARLAGNPVFIKSGTYSITSASTNVSGGCVSDAVGGNGKMWDGYQTIRGDLGTAPILQASGISTATLWARTAAGTQGGLHRNITIDGNAQTAITGLSCARRDIFYQFTVKNCTTIGITITSSTSIYIKCRSSANAGGWTGTFAYLCYACEADANTATGFVAAAVGCSWINCIARSNTGVSSDGFLLLGVSSVINCDAYANGRDGFRSNSESDMIINCIAESNTGNGYSQTAGILSLWNCAAYLNTAGNLNTNITGPNIGFVTGSGSFFTNAASGDFSLNNTASAGAAARAAGYPGLYPAGLTTGFIDIGAAQHADPAASGGIRLAGPGGLAVG